MTTQTQDVESNKPTNNEQPVKKTCKPKRVVIGSMATLCIVTFVLGLALFVRSLTNSHKLTVTLPLYVAPLLPNSSTSHAHTVVIQDLDGDTTELTVLSASRHNSTVMTFTTTDGEVELYNGLAAFVPKAGRGSSTRYIQAANIRLTHMATPHSSDEVVQYERLVKGAKLELAKAGVPLELTHGHAVLNVDDLQEEGSGTAAETALVEASPVLMTEPSTQAEAEQVVARLQSMFTSSGDAPANVSKAEATLGGNGRRLGGDDNVREDDWPDDAECEAWVEELRVSNPDLYRRITGFDPDSGAPLQESMDPNYVPHVPGADGLAMSMRAGELPQSCQQPSWSQWFTCTVWDPSSNNRCVSQVASALRCDRCRLYFKAKKAKVQKSAPPCRVVVHPPHDFPDKDWRDHNKGPFNPYDDGHDRSSGRCLSIVKPIPPPPKAATGTPCNRHDKCASNLCSLLDTDRTAKCCPRDKWGSYGFKGWCNELRDGESCAFNEQCGADSTCRGGKCRSVLPVEQKTAPQGQGPRPSNLTAYAKHLRAAAQLSLSAHPAYSKKALAMTAPAKDGVLAHRRRTNTGGGDDDPLEVFSSLGSIISSEGANGGMSLVTWARSVGNSDDKRRARDACNAVSANQCRSGCIEPDQRKVSQRKYGSFDFEFTTDLCPKKLTFRLPLAGSLTRSDVEWTWSADANGNAAASNGDPVAHQVYVTNLLNSEAFLPKYQLGHADYTETSPFASLERLQVEVCPRGYAAILETLESAQPQEGQGYEGQNHVPISCPVESTSCTSCQSLCDDNDSCLAFEYNHASEGDDPPCRLFTGGSWMDLHDGSKRTPSSSISVCKTLDATKLANTPQYLLGAGASNVCPLGYTNLMDEAACENEAASWLGEESWRGTAWSKTECEHGETLFCGYPDTYIRSVYPTGCFRGVANDGTSFGLFFNTQVETKPHTLANQPDYILRHLKREGEIGTNPIPICTRVATAQSGTAQSDPGRRLSDIDQSISTCGLPWPSSCAGTDQTEGCRCSDEITTFELPAVTHSELPGIAPIADVHIPANAFRGCAALAHVGNVDNVASVGTGAFLGTSVSGCVRKRWRGVSTHGYEWVAPGYVEGHWVATRRKCREAYADSCDCITETMTRICLDDSSWREEWPAANPDYSHDICTELSGVTCSVDTECPSNNCAIWDWPNTKCCPNSARHFYNGVWHCTSLVLGMSCEVGRQCSSGHCDGNVCADPEASGSTCEHDAQCSSNTCGIWGDWPKKQCCPTREWDRHNFLGHCKNLALGDSCEVGWQCSSGFCDGNACVDSQAPIPPTCFDGASLLQTPSGPRRADAVKIGDTVLAAAHDGHLIWDEIAMVLPHNSNSTYDYLQISTSADVAITISPDHYMHAAKPGLEHLSCCTAETAVTAANVAVGDTVWVTSDSWPFVTDLNVTKATVTEIKHIQRDSAYNFLLERSGKTDGHFHSLVVSGVAATSFTKQWRLIDSIGFDKADRLRDPMRGLEHVASLPNVTALYSAALHRFSKQMEDLVADCIEGNMRGCAEHEMRQKLEGILEVASAEMGPSLLTNVFHLLEVSVEAHMDVFGAPLRTARRLVTNSLVRSFLSNHTVAVFIAHSAHELAVNICVSSADCAANWQDDKSIWSFVYDAYVLTVAVLSMVVILIACFLFQRRKLLGSGTASDPEPAPPSQPTKVPSSTHPEKTDKDTVSAV